MSGTPCALPSNPYLASTGPCTVRASLCRSTMNFEVSVPCSCSSFINRSWNSGSPKPLSRSLCNLKACSRVMGGKVPVAALRSSMPIKSKFRREPNFSESARDVNAPVLPALLTRRPLLVTSARASFVASISLTSRIVAVPGTETHTASSLTACLTVTSTSAASASVPTGGASGPAAGSDASTSLSSRFRARLVRWNSSSPSRPANCRIISMTPSWLPSKPCRGSTALCTVRRSFCRSTRNCLEPLGWLSSSSDSLLWKPSSAKASCKSLCKLKACSLVRLGAALGASPRAASAAAAAASADLGSAPGAAPARSTRPRAKLSCRPSASNSACPLKAPSACIICQTPLWLPSKPCSGSTAPCTVRKSLWRSVLNCLEPLGCVACSSRSFSWKSSLEKPRRRSRCKLKACSSVRLGWPPACFASGSICAAEPAGASGAGSRLSTPMSSRLLRLPSFSASVKEVNAPASPALLTSRPLAMMSGRPSLPATAAFTSPMLAVPGTMTCTSPSALRACLTFTSTSGVASSPRLAVLSASAIAASGG
mmetsp:Transcript_15069/g.47491  ORF Transcript_15069/g.47491 Transcript_15069/m.47491 type:complete len:540 (-) Transcript_15069:174-1793(-)